MINFRLLLRKRWLNLSLFLTTFFLWIFVQFFNSSLVYSQSLTPERVAEIVYQEIPDLPIQNNYISVSSNQQAIENTFLSRLIRYHQNIKARSTDFRLDWKLTLADYLRKNEIIDEQRYPGNSTLTQNPLEDDRTVVQNLTMKQRDQLVNALVNVYNPIPETTTEQKPPSQASPNTTQPNIILPKPGSADLLKP